MERLFYTLIYKPGKNWVAGKSIREQDLNLHREYHQKLLEKNKIILGGAFIKKDEGINILSVSDFEEAKRIAENDPAIKNSILEVDVQPLYLVFRSKNSNELDMYGLDTE